VPQKESQILKAKGDGCKPTPKGQGGTKKKSVNKKKSRSCSITPTKRMNLRKREKKKSPPSSRGTLQKQSDEKISKAIHAFEVEQNGPQAIDRRSTPRRRGTSRSIHLKKRGGKEDIEVDWTGRKGGVGRQLKLAEGTSGTEVGREEH